MADVIEITGLGRAGDGIAGSATDRLYVPLTLPGETVEVERHDNRGRVTGILAASPDRIAPICRHFGSCGGCSLQHMSPPAYLAWKRQVVSDCFEQRGIAATIEPVVPIALHSRRRATFSAIRTAGGMVLGFHQRGTNRIVALEECPVLVPAITDKLAWLADLAEIVHKRGKPTRLVVLAASNGLDIAVEAGTAVKRTTLERLGALAGDTAIARLTVDGAEIFLNRRPELRIEGVSLFPVPGGFVQAAAEAEDTLAAATLDHIGTVTPIADLFCGIGTFAMRLAKNAPVTAIDGSTDLVDAAMQAANAAQGLKSLTVRKRDLFQNPLSPVELKNIGGVVFDPPAAGAKAQAEALAASQVPKVVAVSCNPATLARDARILLDGGYRLKRVLPVDQFLFSPEIEVVATFER